MKDTAPKGLGVIAIAALFGFIALLVAYLILNFATFASIVIGGIVALITAIVLWLGWREPAEGPSGPRDLRPNTAATTAAAPAASVATASAPVVAKAPAPAPAPAPVAKAAKPAAKATKPAAKAAKPAAKPAAKAAKPAAKAAKPAVKPVAKDGKPEMLSKPRGGAGDDLKQIKGVGPKMETMLNTMGVWHFDQVASWRKAEVQWVDDNLEGFKGRVSRDEWVKQAKVLAKGGVTEFSKKVKKGGVY